MANPEIVSEWLREHPARIARVRGDGSIIQRRRPCEGGCGRMVWSGICRKCRRKAERDRH